jgi:hypothetical protein
MKQPTFTYLFSLLFLFSFLFLANTNAFAQDDETEIYDVIYLKKGGSLKGEILVFEERDGDITFRDTQGRTYSFSREDYDYFIEDKVFTPRKKKVREREIRPRKENELEFSLGFSMPVLTQTVNLEMDEYYIGYPYTYLFFPLSFKAGVGKYLDRQNYVGLNVELGFAGETRSYFDVGVKYAYQYDGHKSNVAFYIPVEAAFNSTAITSRMTVNDTVFTNNGWSWPDDRYIDINYQSFRLGIGHGVSFILNNKKSIAIEASLFNHFILSEEFPDLDVEAPVMNSNFYGWKLAVFFNL